MSIAASLRQLDRNGPAAKETIRTLALKKVALTSTLPVIEKLPVQTVVTNEDWRWKCVVAEPTSVLSTMSTDARVRYLQPRAGVLPEVERMFAPPRKAMNFKRALVEVCGLPIAGLDPDRQWRRCGWFRRFARSGNRWLKPASCLWKRLGLPASTALGFWVRKLT